MKHFKRIFFPILLLTVLFAAKTAALKAQTTLRYNLIPYPASLKVVAGKFTIDKQTVLVVPSDGRFKNEATFIKPLLSIKTVSGKSSVSGNAIVLQYDASVNDAESYRLSVTPEQIVLSAGQPAGMFMAIQTLRQLMPVNTGNAISAINLVTIPCVEIKDHPAFPWRGMMLDVSRHFFSLNYVKHFIDMMALYKMNKLHMHLTDDQGWRIEIKQYPELTAKSAWRTFNNQDSNCIRLAKETGNTDFEIDTSHIIHKDGKTLYGGYYTQNDIKEIIRYAAARYIEVIPEIDMPGHMKAAADVYSYLTCPGPSTQGEGFSVPICPCNEDVLTFAKNVYGEIADLFPSKYIHIGGDEVERSHWANSQACKDFMAKNGIENLDKLQSYFTREMEKFYHSKGKRLIGWDEVIEGGVDTTTTVMWWRTWAKNGPLHAAENHSQVIMTPDGPFYFDAFPDNNSIFDVYHYSIIPKQLNAEQAKYVIGGQANLWTETVPSEKRADYLIMPLMTALAESVWTNNDDLYNSYRQRLTAQYPLMEKLHINYRLPDLGSLPDRRVFVTNTAFSIASPVKDFSIHYTTDGNSPSASSPLLSKSINVNQSMILKLALFTNSGRRGDVYTISYDKQSYATAENINGAKPGLLCNYYNGSYNKTTAIKSEADSSFQAANVSFNKNHAGKPFGLKFNGYINVPQTAVYTFHFTCDDGGVLRIANRLVVDNDGLHSAKEKSGQVALSKGLHPFSIDFIEGGGGYTLKLKYSIGNGTPADIPAAWFKSK